VVALYISNITVGAECLTTAVRITVRRANIVTRHEDDHATLELLSCLSTNLVTAVPKVSWENPGSGIRFTSDFRTIIRNLRHY